MLKQSKSLPTPTKAAAARSSEGKNYISIQMDGKDISSPRVSEEINSDSCIISGDFTPETRTRPC